MAKNRPNIEISMKSMEIKLKVVLVKENYLASAVSTMILILGLCFVFKRW